MNKFYTLLVALSVGAMSFGQIAFQSNLSSWDGGNPTDWMGSRTSLAAENVIENTVGVTYGTSSARLVNAEGSHKRFTTMEVPVTGGETYEIKMWLAGAEGCELRTNFYNSTAGSYGSYNDYIDIHAETGGALGMVSQTVNVPDGCTAGEFILSIRNTDALVGIVLDSVSIEVTDPVVPTAVSIYDIQYATEAPYASSYDGTLVSTSGIVTGVFLSGSSEGRFFIQDGTGAWNGVYVYENGTPVNLGDSVTVVGTVDEFYELTEIVSVSSITVVSSGNPLPEAVEVSTADVSLEEYEGVVVKVTDAKCTNADAGYGQFEVNDDSGARLIDDEMFSYTATLGNYYSITGVNFLSFGDVKIYPRSIDDITVTGFASVVDNNASAISIYPNPANDQLTINTTNNNATVAIYSVTGELVYTGNTTNKVIDITALNAGVYAVVVSTENSTSSTRLVVE